MRGRPYYCVRSVLRYIRLWSHNSILCLDDAICFKEWSRIRFSFAFLFKKLQNWKLINTTLPRVGDSGQYQFRNLRYNSCKYRVIPKKIVIDWYCFQYYEIVIAYIHLQLIKVHVFSFLFLTLFQLIQFFIFFERVVFF